MAKKTLNILHTESSCGWGGQEIRILTESQGMIQRGHHVVIVCCPTSTLYREAHHYGVPVVALPIEKKRLSCLRAMRRWLKTEGRQFDVINTHSSTDSWLAAAACAVLKGMPPIIRTRHVSTHVSKSMATRWLYLHACQHIVTTGGKLRQYLHTHNTYPLSHMTSVPTGIDLTRFHPEDKLQSRQRIGIENKPTLGIVATMRTWKGHRYLLDSWKILHQHYPDWQLLFVGDGPQRKNLEPHVQQAGLTGSVIFLGNRQDVPDCLNAMDIFALPSFGNEGVPQGIMQAMACGLPVVSTSVGAITEAVIDGDTGYIIEPKNAEQLTEKLDFLMKDAELRSQMGNASLQRATHLFGMDNMLEKMESIFYRSINSKR